MKYCSHCGEEILFSIPEGDNRPRYWCNHCGVIHYQNPKIVVGAIPVWEGRFLLCKRAIEPRIGYWTRMNSRSSPFPRKNAHMRKRV